METRISFLIILLLNIQILVSKLIQQKISFLMIKQLVELAAMFLFKFIQCMSHSGICNVYFTQKMIC